jgi:hypothetical protein
MLDLADPTANSRKGERAIDGVADPTDEQAAGGR